MPLPILTPANGKPVKAKECSACYKINEREFPHRLQFYLDNGKMIIDNAVADYFSCRYDPGMEIGS